MIINYEITRCYVIDFVEYNLITKILKRSSNWIKLNLRRLITAAATFIAVMTSIIAKEVYIIEVIIHDTPEVRFSIFAIISDFSLLWQDIENVKNVSELKWMNISLFDNWRELYKSD